MIHFNLKDFNTGYVCASDFAELSCPKGFIIFINRVEYKSVASQCNDNYNFLDFTQMMGESLHNCIGVEKNNQYFMNACNANQKCHVKIERKAHKMGHEGTNCDFESKMANIHYSCVPGI